MTHRQTPPPENTPPADHHTLRETICTFLNDRFAGQSGWLCLGWIDGDPQIEPLREEWYQMPRQAHTVTIRTLELAECGCNLYVALCLFSQRKRSYATALPSAWLWIDDAAIAGAELVESSAGNFQSWLKLDQPLSAQERSMLQRALRDTTTGADNCSADAVHMARLPGGWNRKHHGSWHVRVAQSAGPVASVAELRLHYPMRVTHHAHAAEGDWRDLPSGSQLAQSRRFTALVKANEQLRKVCAGERVALRMKNGRDDDSLSNQRAIFACQLIHAHYPHAEIRALAQHFAGVLASQPARFESDIDNLLRRYTPTDYVPEPTRSRASTRQPAPPRGGRHYSLTAGELLDVYHLYADCGPRGIVLEWTRAEIAQRLGVSYDTVKRREAELIAAGQIRREVSDDYQRSFVILSPGTWDVCAERTRLPNTRTMERSERIYANEEPAQPDGENPRALIQSAAHACAEITHHPNAAGHGLSGASAARLVPVANACEPAGAAAAAGGVCLPARWPLAVLPSNCWPACIRAGSAADLGVRVSSANNAAPKAMSARIVETGQQRHAARMRPSRRSCCWPLQWTTKWWSQHSSCGGRYTISEHGRDARAPPPITSILAHGDSPSTFSTIHTCFAEGCEAHRPKTSELR